MSEREPNRFGKQTVLAIKFVVENITAFYLYLQIEHKGNKLATFRKSYVLLKVLSVLSAFLKVFLAKPCCCGFTNGYWGNDRLSQYMFFKIFIRRVTKSPGIYF